MEPPSTQAEREIKCEYCGRKFHNKANRRRHKRLNRCPNRPQEQESRQSTPMPVLDPQMQPLPQSQSQLPPQLSAMSHQQRIEWINKLLMDNDERISQSIVQLLWTMAGTTPIRLPTGVSGNSTEDEAGEQPQPALSKPSA